MTPLYQFGPGAFDVPLSVWRPFARFLGLVVLSGVVSAAAALGYRWYTRERIRAWLTAVFGGSSVAVYLNAVGLFQQVLGSDSTTVFDPGVVFFNATTIVAALVVSPVGRSVGDRVATDVFAVAGVRELDAEVSRLVRSVGRVTAVELPEEIGDVDGYDPVSAEKKEEIAGKTLLFPRRLTGAELRDRLVTRLKEDHGVGHVDFDVDDEGEIEFLAVGSRVAGIGPTLATGAVAVAIRADPASDASPGDRVQIWRTGTDQSADLVGSAGGDANPPPELVATGELRAAVDDVATVAVDAAEAGKLDAATAYRLVTLPAEPQADREFASLLRASDETMGAVEVGAESDLDGATIAELDVTVAAVRPADGTVEPIPPRARTLVAGDTTYVLARPDGLRRLEARAEAGVRA